MSVIVILAYLLTRIKYFTEILDKKFTFKNRAVFILFFGAFSIFGTYLGIEMLGAVAYVRDSGPMIARINWRSFHRNNGGANWCAR